MSEKGSFDKPKLELPQPEETLALGFDPNNSSLEYLDKLRSDAYSRGGEESEEFKEYNNLYIEKLFSHKKQFEDLKQDMPLRLEYTENFNQAKVDDTSDHDKNTSLAPTHEFKVGINQDSRENKSASSKEINETEISKLENEISNLREELKLKDDIIAELTERINKLEELANNKSGIESFSDQDTDTNHKYNRVDKNEKENSKKGFFGKIGRKIMGFFKKHKKGVMIGTAGVIAGGVVGGMAMAGSSEQKVDVEPEEPKVEDTHKSQSITEAQKRFKDFASLTDDGSEMDPNKELDKNGKYNKENDEYYKEGKENAYSIGTSTAELSNEEYQDKYIDNFNEDNIHRNGQFFINDLEAAKTYLGLETKEEVDRFLDSVQEGKDEAAFQKLNEATVKYLDGAKVVGNGNLGNDTWYSMYVDGNHNYVQSRGEFGGTYRVIELKSGEQIFVRDNCQQIIMKVENPDQPPVWNVPFIPVNEIPPTSETPPPTSETPPPTSETPPPTSETPPPTSETPPPTSETPPPTSETPPPTSETPPPTSEIKSKDRTLEDFETYKNITQEGSGELTEEVSEEEQRQSINPNAQSGTNVEGVIAEGADKETNSSYNNPQQYGGEMTVEGAAQQALNVERAKQQELANAAAAESAKVNTVNIGGEEFNLEEIEAAQTAANQNQGDLNANK